MTTPNPIGDIERAKAFWAAIVGQEFSASFEPTFRRARVQAIGGSFVDRVRNEHGGHITCTDPDGNEFCLTSP